MKHAILGNGNLGNAIATKLLKKQHHIKIFSTYTGWKYPINLQPIYDFTPDHIWVTVGAGSVDQAKSNYLPFIDLHLRLPMELAQQISNNVTLHFFSTDYVTSPFKSLYALSKIQMEDSLRLLNRQKTYIYRIGSLYGTHKPNKCFPYKLKKNWIEAQKKKKEIELPLNEVIPTPADWLADVLISNLEAHNKSKIYHVAPEEKCTIKDWGELILKRKIAEKEIDLERPLTNKIICDLPIIKKDTWLNLWKERESEWLEILDKIE